GGGELHANLLIGSQSGSQGTFELDAGTLVSADGDEVVGDAGTGKFIQKGGTNTIDNGGLFVGDSGGDGSYTLGGTGALAITGGKFQIGVGGASSGKVNF